MKRFVIRVMMFALLVVGLVGGACALEIAAEVWFYRHRELVAPEGATVFVCGDSKTEMGLNPEYWPELFNFSLCARPVDQMRLTAVDLIEANPGKFKTMLIDASPESAREVEAVPIDKSYGAGHFLLYYLHPGEHRRNMTGVLSVLHSLMTGKRWRVVSKAIRGRRPFSSSLASGFHRVHKCRKRTMPEKYGLDMRIECDRVRGILANPAAQVEYFDMIGRAVDYAQGRGIDVVIMHTPWHRDMIETAGADLVRRFTDYTRDFARRKGCAYLNLMAAEIPEEGWFNASHMNERGAKVLTEMVRDRLKDLVQ